MRRGDVVARVGSVSVSSCRCMFVSCVHPVTVLNDAFCMTCSLLIIVQKANGDHMEEAYSRAGLITTLFILRSRFLLYSAGSGVNKVQVVLSVFSVRLFCFVQAKTLYRYGCMYFLATLVLVCMDVMVMSFAYDRT